MNKFIQVKEVKQLNDELSHILEECDLAFQAWYQDRSNMKLLAEYRQLLEKRDDLIKKVKSFIIIH